MAYSGAQLTRLGLAAITRGLYGSFAGKAVAVLTLFAPEGDKVTLEVVPVVRVEKDRGVEVR